MAQDGLWVGLLRPLIAADSSDATTNRLLTCYRRPGRLTAAIENLNSGPPWEWLAVFFRTFWSVGIEQQQPLGGWGLVIALAFCLLVAVAGLIKFWQQPDRRPPTADGRQTEPELRTTKYAIRNTHSRPQSQPPFRPPAPPSGRRLRPAPDPLRHHLQPGRTTAQGRHILFQTAPAFAILLIWGLSVISYQLSVVSREFLPNAAQFAIRNSQFTLPLFLFIWTLTQLWTMTWAYLPPLPVQTLPRASIDRRLEQALNDQVTLVGFETAYDAQNRVLQVELIWNSTAVSPVDYLTELTFSLDAQGQAQSQWLGHPAQGRYPTRAWDPATWSRDTAWLPTGGLDAGQYTLTLDVQTTRLNPPLEEGCILGVGFARWF